MKPLLLALALSAQADADLAAPAAAAREIEAAEANFAAEADRIGIVPAFRQFVGPDAVMFLPRPVIINPRLDKANWPGNLDWRPEGIGVSADGSTAFSLGPSAWRFPQSTDHGYYLTIWKRQPDGGWKFVVDRNNPMSEDVYGRTAVAPRKLFSAAAGAPLDPAALEAALAAEMKRDGAAAALKARLAKDAFVLRPSRRLGEADAAASLKPGCETRQTVLGTGVGADGSMAWSWGEVRCEGAEPVVGHFVRVWQQLQDGPRITMDQMGLDPA